MHIVEPIAPRLVTGHVTAAPIVVLADARPSDADAARAGDRAGGGEACM
jgi:hypothetical protein